MSSLATNLPRTRRPAARLRRAPVAAAIVFAATGLFDLIAQPYLGDHHYHSPSAYTFSALLIPFALAMLWTLVDLRHSTGVDSRLATSSLRIAGAGLVLFTPCAISSLATANARALGPVYMISMLLSLVGTGLLALALARAGALARWAAVALPLAWLIGGPVGEGQIVRGTALVLAAAVIGITTTAEAPVTK